MKILLTGATGQVGWELLRTLMPFGEIIPVNRAQVDIGNIAGLKTAIQEIKPDIIVNPAAYTAVDKAETEQELAHVINAEAPGAIAEMAKQLGALLIHYSTDYVFDGTKTGAYFEDDLTNPVSVYGKTKLAGELAIQATGADYLTLRTSWVYASRGNNFLKTILRLAAEREELKIVADQIGAPTWARLIAETTALVVKQAIAERRTGQFNSGIYHLTTSGETSWHGFAEKIVAIARSQNNLTLKNKVISPIPTSGYPLPAPRPANSRLSLDKLEQRFGLIMPSWDNALALCMQDIN